LPKRSSRIYGSNCASVPAPSPHDFLGIDALLNDDERLIRDTVRKFVRDRVLPNIAQWFEDHMPWLEKYRKPDVRGITANAIEVVAITAPT